MKISKLSLILLIATISACSSTPKVATAPEVLMADDCMYKDAPQTKAPLWVCDVPLEGFALSAVGFSEKRPTQSMTSAAAKADANIQMAEHFATSVAQLFTDAQKSLVTENIEKFIVDTSLVKESMTSATLYGAKVYRSVTSPAQGYYVVLAMDQNTYEANAERIFAALVDDNANIKKMFEDEKARERLMNLMKKN